jgi:hypothetical protein
LNVRAHDRLSIVGKGCSVTSKTTHSHRLSHTRFRLPRFQIPPHPSEKPQFSVSRKAKVPFKVFRLLIQQERIHMRRTSWWWLRTNPTNHRSLLRLKPACWGGRQIGLDPVQNRREEVERRKWGVIVEGDADIFGRGFGGGQSELWGTSCFW